jgi:hypothetical protein
VLVLTSSLLFDVFDSLQLEGFPSISSQTAHTCQHESSSLGTKAFEWTKDGHINLS